MESNTNTSGNVNIAHANKVTVNVTNLNGMGYLKDIAYFFETFGRCLKTATDPVEIDRIKFCMKLLEHQLEAIGSEAYSKIDPSKTINQH